MDVALYGNKYQFVVVGLMENLSSDLILEQDFQQKDETFVIEYGESRTALKVGKCWFRKREKFLNSDASDRSSCNMTAASTPPVKLFENLWPGCKPIAAKFLRYSKADRKFIEQEVQEMLEDDIIQPSTSRWRAQIVVTQDRNQHRRKRLCVDFSQTINVYTELDAYLLPKIYDMVNQIADYSVFSTFNLRSAQKTGFILPKLMEDCMNSNVSLWVLQMVYRSFSVQ